MSREQKLQELLMELYVAGVLWQDWLSEADQQRVLTTVQAAVEGREFELLGLPAPTSPRAAQTQGAGLNRRYSIR